MIVETIHLTVNSEMTILIDGNPQVSLDGRPLRRSATGGRFFVYDQGILRVTLDQGASFRDQALTLNPPASITVNGDRRFDDVKGLNFVGMTMQIDSDTAGKKRETINTLDTELQSLHAQEAQRRQELQNVQNAINQLNSTIADLQQQNAQMSSTITGLQQQNDQLNSTVTSLQQQNNQLTAANGSLTKLQSDLARVGTALAQAQQRSAMLNQQFAEQDAARALVVQENEITAAAIRVLQEQIAQEQAQRDALIRQQDELTADLSNYSPAVIEALRSSITALQEQHASGKSEWTRLSGEKLVWERRCEDQRTANERLVVLIGQQPEELRNLQQAHEALSRRLTETINAQEICSEEKQQELQRQLDEQEPIAEQLTRQYEELQDRIAQINNIIDDLRTARDAQLLQLWPQLTQAMEDIRSSIGGMNAELETLQTDAARFNQNVRTCAERLEALKEWYHVDRTPLLKLQMRLGDMTASENEQLLRTMNPGSIERVHQLFDNIDSGLAELDDILRDVIRAAQSDEKFLNLKATTNEQHARQEMKG